MLAQSLCLINMFVAAVVSRSGVSLRVLVLHDTSKSAKDRLRREVLRGNQVNEVALSVLLLQIFFRQFCMRRRDRGVITYTLKDVVHLRVVL